MALPGSRPRAGGERWLRDDELGRRRLDARPALRAYTPYPGTARAKMHRFQKWRDALQVAPNEAAVIGVMHNYVESLPDVVRAILPRECTEALKPPFDVSHAAVTLLQAELFHRGDEEERKVLHEVAHTFAVAAVRLASVSAGQAPATAH